jgi:ABC-type transport system substrate-binding protein
MARGSRFPHHPGVYESLAQLRAGRLGRREFLRTATLLGTALPVAAALAACERKGQQSAPATPAAAADSAAGAPRKGGTLRVSMRCQEMSDPATFDWTEKSNVARQVLEYLTITGPDNITRPYLCERWEASEDLKTWTLHLRQGVKWNNGDDFGADDVVFNFARWLDARTGSSNQALFGAMVSHSEGRSRMRAGAVEKVDAHTVRLHLHRAELAIPENLYNYPTAIVHRRFAEDGGDFARHPVGTGPYRLEDFAVGRKAVLAKRDPKAYWGAEVYLDRIEYIDHGDEAAAGLAALASGQVELVHEAFVEQLDVIARIPGARLYETVTAQTGVARMQVDRKPFDDVRVRSAVRLCQDHERLLAVAYRGRGAPAQDHHVAPIHPDYAPMPTPRQDYARARALLAEAGHADGIDLQLDCKKEPPWELAVAQALAEMCKPAGIRIRLNVMPNAQYWEIWDKTAFGFTGWTHRPLGVMTLNLAYRSGVPWNETHYANPEFDRTLDAAGALLDPEARRTQMARLQQMLQRDAVIAQPLWRSVFAASSARVQGYRLHPTLYHQLHGVWLS